MERKIITIYHRNSETETKEKFYCNYSKSNWENAKKHALEQIKKETTDFEVDHDLETGYCLKTYDYSDVEIVWEVLIKNLGTKITMRG